MVQKTIFISLPLEDLQSVIQNAVNEAFQKQDNCKSKQEHNQYYTRKQTAKKLHISLGTLDTYTRLNILKAYKIGHRVLYLKSDIDFSLSQKFKSLK